MMRLEALVTGRARTVCALIVNDRCDFREWFEQIGERPRKRIRAVMVDLAEGGNGGGIERFRHLTGQVYEIKEHSIPLRVFCFFHEGNLVVCTHGVTKPKPRRLRDEIDKALALRQRLITEGVSID
jgi:hypothetical protein